MAYSSSWGSTPPNSTDYSAFRSEVREPGARRRKLAGYLKAANELRQTYFSQDGTDARDMAVSSGVEGPGAFPDAAVVRNGNEEMILFPSYARKHTKIEMRPFTESSTGVSEQEYWQREWEKHQDDNAIVDADVRGWIYTPHRGHANRKQRLMIGLARQLSGIPAPTSSGSNDSASTSGGSSRAPSPSRQDEDFIYREAENIVRKGEQEQRVARRGGFSEVPERLEDPNSISGSNGQQMPQIDPRYSERDGFGSHRLSQISLASSTDGESLTPPKKRESWQRPERMSTAELHTANGHLINRLRPFMATPLANTPISAFFYNETASRQHTVYTNAAGHFSCRAPLDFVPTHVRVLAGEKLSATEPVTVTSPTGVSLVSDIDDTIKHSAITAGAREIFRTAFIRELGDLTIEGVQEWYNKLHGMGVEFHYVSNSPWQMYPILTTYFKLAHLPRGSFHLKQYTGMLQGIFEPVAERKRANLERIFRDFPERKFILVGDSGEADLEVYTEIALAYSGRVIGIFIRDVTTPLQTGYFDQSSGGMSGNRQGRNGSTYGNADGELAKSKRLQRPEDTKDDDADLRAAIAASLADMEAETKQARRNINPDTPSADSFGKTKKPPALPQRRNQASSGNAVEDLIDFSEDPIPPRAEFGSIPRKPSAHQADLALLAKKPSPSPPPKPQQLRSPSPTSQQPKSSLGTTDCAGKAPPPRPRKPSTAIKPPSAQQIQAMISGSSTLNFADATEHQPSPLRQIVQQSPVDSKRSRPPLPTRPDHTAISKGKEQAPALSRATTAVWDRSGSNGSPRPITSGGQQSASRAMSVVSSKSSESLRPLTALKSSTPAPPPRRRNTPVLPLGTISARTSSNRVSGAWDDAGGGSLPGSPSEAGVSRKEFLWMQRWARAKRILEPQGVTLRTWRVGRDVADVTVKLVELAFRDMEKDKRDNEFRKTRR